MNESSQALKTYSDCNVRTEPTPEPDPTFYTYSPDELEGKENGSILRCERLDFDTRYETYTTYRVMYRTSTPITENGVTTTLALPATGMVYVPKSTATSRPVIANTHGLTGMIPGCGPSLSKGFDSALISKLLAVVEDAVVVVPDYVGLGLDHGGRVPDVAYQVRNPLNPFQHVRPFSNITHPFVSLQGEGRATVDLVRAATSLPDAGTGSAPEWFAAGQSQGGHAALSTADVVSLGYGAEMSLLGVIAGAPATEFENRNWDRSLKRGIEAMVTVGLTLENRDLRASSYLTDKAMGAFWRTTNQECTDATGLLNMINYYAYAGAPWRADPYNDPEALAVISANSPGRVNTTIPVFVGQIVGDPLIRKERTRSFAQKTAQFHPDFTYCEYAPIDDPGLALLLRMNNHDAFRRMADDGAVCSTPGGTPQTITVATEDGPAEQLPLTLMRWVAQVYD